MSIDPMESVEAQLRDSAAAGVTEDLICADVIRALRLGRQAAGLAELPTIEPTGEQSARTTVTFPMSRTPGYISAPREAMSALLLIPSSARRSITSIARELGVVQPTIVKLAGEMRRSGMVENGGRIETGKTKPQTELLPTPALAEAAVTDEGIARAVILRRLMGRTGLTEIGVVDEALALYADSLSDEPIQTTTE